MVYNSGKIMYNNYQYRFLTNRKEVFVLQPKKKKTGLIVGLVVGIPVFILVLVFTLGTALSLLFGVTVGNNFLYSEGRTTRFVQEINSPAYVGVLRLEGVISGNDGESYNHHFFVSQLEEMLADSNNVALLLYVDSPGGSVYYSDELYLKLCEYKAEKPVYTYMDSIAASGGYYVGCVGQDIMINRNGMTGSIGVISGTIYDISEFLAQNGVKATVMHAGANKAMGDFTQPFTAEQQAIYQSLLDECYDQFVDIVAAERNMPREKVLQLADGRVYTPKQALQNGLVDSIGTYEQYEAFVRGDLNTNVTFEHIYYAHQFSLKDIFNVIASGNRGETGAILDMVQKQFSGPQYLYQG